MISGTAGIEQILQRTREYLPPEKTAVIESAFEYAAKAHEGQVRQSGEPYITHPLQTALTLVDLKLDASSIAAALLHDVAENCGVPIAAIEARFGPEIASLVDGSTRLGKISLHTGIASREAQAENLRKMLVAMAQDLRVVFIKLADRLHNMLTLEALQADKQRHIAQETLEIYAPLAHRLGIWELKWQLEDQAFRFLQPETYHQIAERVASRRTERESFIGEAVRVLKNETDRMALKGDVSGRVKHIYSIHQKMEKYALSGKDFDDIHDLLAVRMLVNTIPDCYTAVGAVHSLWHPMPDEFDDYIANPKLNGYQSLHTAVMCMGRVPLEVQIRTHDMHRVAEYGVAAHWRYKEGARKDVHFEERVSWLRQLIDWHRELSGAEEFLESVKTDVFMDQVFVYTPKGEIKDLPQGSTPIDFAYRVHTELGHSAIGAKVNGKLVTLNYQLKNGEIVEILSAKKGKGPSRDWLSPHLGYARTTGARQKIRQWFKKLERAENIEQGRVILEKELRHLGIRLNEREAVARLFKYDDLDEFLAAIGEGSIPLQQIALRVAAQQEQAKPAGLIVEPAAPRPSVSGIHVLGVGDLFTRLAQCCHPVPGDKIIGYVTRSRGVAIHRLDCYNVVHEDEKERLISVEWGQIDSVFPVNIKVEAWDRVGLLRDITAIVAEEKVNILAVSIENSRGENTNLYFTLETKGLTQLSRLLVKMEGIRGIVSVSRIANDTKR